MVFVRCEHHRRFKLTKRIHEDLDQFKDVIRGKIRKELGDLIGHGSIFPLRGKDGKISISIPKITIPYFVHGDNGSGVGKGPGKPGDVIKKAPDGKDGEEAGDQHGEGQIVNIELEDVLNLLQEELKLPDLKPKPQEVFEDIKYKYNSISLIGPNSLRHTRRTLKEAIKRTAASGDLDKLVSVPGCIDPIRIVTPIKADFRYRQYREIKIPSSNAVVFFSRDWSGSMDKARCDIVSDMSWWIDCFIRKFYKRVERVYIGHDVVAEECSEDKFYKYRMGGGTMCSSAMKLISSMFENRFKPNQWNIYIFYFTDGDNWNEDNNHVVNVMKDNFRPEVINMFGITQIMSWNYQHSLKSLIDRNLQDGTLQKNIIKTTSIGDKSSPSSPYSQNPYNGSLTNKDRNAQIMQAIKDLLGPNNSNKIEK